MSQSSTPPAQKGKGNTLYFLILAAVIVVWGASFVIVDLAEKVATPITVATWRWIYASILFLVLTPVAKKRNFWDLSPSLTDTSRGSTKKRKVYVLMVVVLSIIGISLFFPIQYTAIDLVGPSITSLMVCLGSPIIIAAISVVAFKERLTRLQVVGFVISSIGAFLIITHGDITQIMPASTNFLGNMLALLQPFLWAAYSVLSKKAMEYGTSFQVMSYVSYLGTGGLLLVAAVNGDMSTWSATLFQPAFLECVLYLAVGCSIFGYVLWNVALDRLPSANVGAFLYVEPFVTVLVAWIVLQQLIPPLSIVGGGIVIVGLAIISRPARKKIEKEEFSK
jgi:drug/metabolite transporter (DMT)-like permease